MTAALDFSYARPNPADCVAVGAPHLLAYTGSGKPRPSYAYIASILAAGGTFTFIQESYATRAQEGFSAGADDGHYADAQVDVVGYPETAAVAYCASDGNAQSPGPGAAPAIQEYGRGVASTSRRPLLAYGNRVAVDAFRRGAGALCVGTWVPSTWGAIPGTDVLVQEANIASPIADTDWNSVYGDWPRWSNIPPPAPHRTLGDRMEVVIFPTLDGGGQSRVMMGNSIVREFAADTRNAYGVPNNVSDWWNKTKGHDAIPIIELDAGDSATWDALGAGGSGPTTCQYKPPPVYPTKITLTGTVTP